MRTIALSKLTQEDLKQYPVWEMVDAPGDGDAVVTAVTRIPVKTLRNRLVGTTVQLADGSTVWALLGNVSVDNPRSTKHFATVSVHNDGKWFDLARYHDVDFARRGGDALANFLGKSVGEVFPLTYDLTKVAIGNKDALSGEVAYPPSEQLEFEDLVRLSLEED